MKCISIQVLFYIILFLFLLRFLYCVYINYTKNNLVKQLLHEWTIKTNGYVKEVKLGVYTDDYFLSFSDSHDRKNHIHLITHKFYSNLDEFISIFFTPQFEIVPTFTIGYVIKKNNKHSLPIKINQQKDTPIICYHMIKTYETFN